MSTASTQRPGGLVLASALACALAGALGCTGHREQAPQVPVAAAPVAAPVPPVAPSAGSGSAAADPAGAGDEGVTLPAPPSPDDHNLFGLVRGAGELAKEGSNRVASPDGQRVVFVKPEGPKGKPSLWVSRKDGGEARKLVDVEKTKVENPHPGIQLGETSGITDLSFSPDGKQVYFQADGWATSLALYIVEIESGKLRFVHDANGYAVIRTCTDKKLIGRLLTLQHSYFDPVPSSVVNWYFLIDDQGQRLGIVGPELANVERFLAKRCGVGVAPPDPPKVEVPPRLRVPRLECGDQVVQHDLLKFLDGTSLDMFYVFDKESLKDPDPPHPYDISLDTAATMLETDCPAPKKK